MNMSIIVSKNILNFARHIQSLTGENVMSCYQCKKCTLGCPSAYTMKMKPHELMRAIQLGLEEEIYWSGTIWICLSCETCNTRCPQDINILRVIDGLRELSKNVEHYNPYPYIPALHRIFLEIIKRFGRIYELGLALLINLRMLTPFKDIDMAYPMLIRGKLKILPHKSHLRKELKRVISIIEEFEKNSYKKEIQINQKNHY